MPYISNSKFMKSKGNSSIQPQFYSYCLRHVSSLFTAGYFTCKHLTTFFKVALHLYLNLKQLTSRRQNLQVPSESFIMLLPHFCFSVVPAKLTVSHVSYRTQTTLMCQNCRYMIYILEQINSDHDLTVRRFNVGRFHPLHRPRRPLGRVEV
jgi:hypothetical protein